ncbi:MAG: helix-turn-helix domain-containing protein [Bacilli bacterium]|nr:helix-turn-helix domain-containing protein [Bacilli bacterium]
MDNLSEQIKKRRIEKKMTIEELSKETFLSVAVIKDIEAGKFDQYEGDETYVKMYLKKISNVLDLNKEELTQSYVALTEEIKLAQLKSKEDTSKKQEEVVNKGKYFNFDSPHLARKQSVYEDKSHIKVIRGVIIFALVALVFGVLWWGISSTKSQVDDPTFDPQQQTTTEGQIVDDTDDTKDDLTNDIQNDITNDNFVRNGKLDFTMNLEEGTDEFVFKVVFGNKSWASMKVNGNNYDDFESKIYEAEDVVELKFKVADFENLVLKNGYSMGHKYYINDVEIPLTEDDYSEGVTNLTLTLDKQNEPTE